MHITFYCQGRLLHRCRPVAQESSAQGTLCPGMKIYNSPELCVQGFRTNLLLEVIEFTASLSLADRKSKLRHDAKNVVSSNLSC